MGKNNITLCTIALICLLLSTQGRADLLTSITGQPDTYFVSAEPANVKGLGDIQFGMSIDQVKKQLKKTFGAVDVKQGEEPVHRTPLLLMTLPEFSPVKGAPSPAPVTITFVFGYSNHQLTAINMDWYAESNATSQQREALLTTGSRYLADEILPYFWPPLTAMKGVVTEKGSLILFAGRDEQGAGVEVRVEGVAIDVKHSDGKTEHRPVNQGPAHLYIGLSAQPDQPDTFRLPKGAF